MAALRFRCPHCRQNTIEVRAKLKGAWWPGTCPQCGGRFVPWRLSRWELGSLAAAMAVVVLYAALKPDEPPAPAARDAAAVSPIGTARHFSDPAMQAGYKAALDKAGIPFTLYLSDGMEYVRVEREHAAALERVQREFLSKGGS